MSKAEFHLKVMINKQKTKVLFAEIERDFADVLLSFLTMALGSIVRVINKHYGDKAPVIGSLTSLYKGVSDLDSGLFSSEGAKQMLLNPRSWFNDESRKLKVSLSEPQPAKYFTCEGDHSDQSNVGIYYGTARCSCGKFLSKRITHIREFFEAAECSVGVLTAKAASFILCDDMRIAPNVMGSVLKTYNALGITDTKDAELRNVTLGLSEIMDLLKGMFVSSTPLTDLILNNKLHDDMKREPGIWIDRIEKNVAPNNSKKMILKFMVQKSTSKLLFAQAEEDFVDFLFSLLTVPLGGVESLLGNNTCVKSIDNLHASLSRIDVEKYLKSEDTKSMLLDPKLPHGYLTVGQILLLTEEQAPSLYCNINIFISDHNGFSSLPIQSVDHISSAVSSFKSPKGDTGYVMGPRMYMVTDELTVTPLCMSSSIIYLNGLNVSMSDVGEMTLHIGLEEALSILNASLTSTSALTKGLLLSKKCFKQEQ